MYVVRASPLLAFLALLAAVLEILDENRVVGEALERLLVDGDRARPILLVHERLRPLVPGRDRVGAEMAVLGKFPEPAIVDVDGALPVALLAKLPGPCVVDERGDLGRVLRLAQQAGEAIERRETALTLTRSRAPPRASP